jgi:hypothetical protein
MLTENNMSDDTVRGRGFKYLKECGFNAFQFGINPETGLVDVSTAEDDVCSGVSMAACEEVVEYLSRLEQRVISHINLHYVNKGE